MKKYFNNNLLKESEEVDIKSVHKILAKKDIFVGIINNSIKFFWQEEHLIYKCLDLLPEH